ncbi:MAG TPA: ribonuclease Z [Anaerolineaceae bacterium]
MDRVIILGSSSAVPVAGHENTHLLVETGSRVVLVDCPGTPMVRVAQAGVDPKTITDLILTHFHPDHVSGFAALLMSLWLVGRKAPLAIYGLAPTLERAQKMLDLFDWQQWPNFYPLEFITVPAEEHATLFQGVDLSVYASPTQHLIPTIGLRFEFSRINRVLTYSCDTEPSQAVRRLADGADVLIHEATGTGTGHTTPEKAGAIATQAAAGALYLIHYPSQLIDPESLLARARTAYQGPIFVAEDFQSIDLNAAAR